MTRPIDMTGGISQAARDGAADLSLACFPDNLETAEWMRRGNVPDCAGRTADEHSPWTLAFDKAIADERERCARIAEEYPSIESADIPVIRGIATAIRATGAEGGR